MCDLRQVVGLDPVSGPGPGAFGAVQAGPVPPVPAFEGADPAFAAGPPLDGTAERWPALGGLAGLAGFALAGDDHVADAEALQVVFDRLLAVAAVGGDSPRLAAGSLDDPVHSRGELRAVGRVAPLEVVVDDDPMQPNSTGLPSRPLAIGLASPSCRLTSLDVDGHVIEQGCCSRN